MRPPRRRASFSRRTNRRAVLLRPHRPRRSRFPRPSRHLPLSVPRLRRPRPPLPRLPASRLLRLRQHLPRRSIGPLRHHELNNPFSSFPLAAFVKTSKRPSLAIVRDAFMKPDQAQRASAPPTLILRTPNASTSLRVSGLSQPISRLTGLGATAFTTASICSRVLMPGGYRQSAPASEY